MKNTYLTSHFPLFSIILFSLSFAMFTEGFVSRELSTIGIYEGMMEFFSASGIKLTILFLLFLFFFMVFSALKLIADTVVQLSLLFFSKDEEGKDLTNIRKGSSVYLVGSVLSTIGIYEGMMEFFSASGIKLTILFLLFLFFFMVFSALKLIADTVVQLSLLFFSKDEEGKDLTNIRKGSSVYLVGSVLSLFVIQSIYYLLFIFLLTTLVYFIFFVYTVMESLSFVGFIGLIFFQILFWVTFTLIVVYAFLILYNSFVASLPL